MRGDEHALISLDSVHGHLLERVENELVFAGRFFWGHMIGDRHVGVPWGHGNLVSYLRFAG